MDVRAEGGRIIIEPIMALAYDLDKLLAEMKPESFPENIDFGSPVGRETSLDL